MFRKLKAWWASTQPDPDEQAFLNSLEELVRDK